MRAKHVVQGQFGIGQRHCDDDALARREAVGLDHDRRAMLAHVSERGAEFGEHGVACGGNVVASEKILRECLGAFQLRRDSARAEAAQARRAEAVDHSDRERRFRADHGQRDIFIDRQREQAIDIGDCDLRIAHAGFARGAGVAGRDDDFAHRG